MAHRILVPQGETGPMRSHRIAPIPGDGDRQGSRSGRALCAGRLHPWHRPHSRRRHRRARTQEASAAHRWCSCACVRKPNPSSVSISTCTRSGTPCDDRHATKPSGLTKTAPPLSTPSAEGHRWNARPRRNWRAVKRPLTRSAPSLTQRRVRKRPLQRKAIVLAFRCGTGWAFSAGGISSTLAGHPTAASRCGCWPRR